MEPRSQARSPWFTDRFLSRTGNASSCQAHGALLADNLRYRRSTIEAEVPIGYALAASRGDSIAPRPCRPRHGVRQVRASGTCGAGHSTMSRLRPRKPGLSPRGQASLIQESLHATGEVAGPSVARILNASQAEGSFIREGGLVDACLAVLTASASGISEERQQFTIEGEHAPVKRVGTVRRVLAAPGSVLTVRNGGPFLGGPFAIQPCSRIRNRCRGRRSRVCTGCWGFAAVVTPTPTNHKAGYQ